MKKILLITLVVVVAAATSAYASPTVDPYIQAIASLTSPKASVAAPTGCGAVRDEQTGDFHVLVPREYCGANAPGTVVLLGRTMYDSKIIGYCEEF